MAKKFWATFADRNLDHLKWRTQYQRNQCEEAYETMVKEGRTYRVVNYEKTGKIARATLNRPEKRNALDDALYQDLLAAFGQTSLDPEVRVLIVRAEGSHFSAGHDLSSPYGDESPPIDPKYHPTVRDFYQLERRRCGKYPDMLNIPKFTIAVVKGICIGAGEGIQSICDFTIAAEDARFGKRGFGRMPMGVYLGTQGFAPHGWFGPWPGGSMKVHAGSMYAEVTGRQLADMGQINKAVPLAELDAEVERWALALAELPPGLTAVAKETLDAVCHMAGQEDQTRNHFNNHVALQWVRFRDDEISMYSARKDQGLHGFIAAREDHATVRK